MGEIEGFYALPKMPEEYQQLLDKLFSARRAASLYQPDHPIAIQAREGAFVQLSAVLRRQSKLTLSPVDEGLLVDRKLYRQTADSLAFRKRFQQRGIRRVILKAGVDESELAAVLNLLDTDPTRIRAKGGPALALRDMGVANVLISDERPEQEELPEQEAAPASYELPLDRLEAIISQLADYLVGKSEDLEEEQYTHLIAILKDPSTTTRLLAEAVARADPSQLQKGKSNFTGHLVQKLESTVLARSAADWEEIKHKLRMAVAELPPGIRPRIFTLQAPTWKEEGARSARRADDAPTPERIAGMLNELGKLLAELRGVPSDLAGATAGEGAGYARAGIATDKPGRKSNLSILLDGMANMHIAPTPAKEELADLFQTVDRANDCVNLGWVLLELLEREHKLDTYSKIATELERLAKLLIENGQDLPALHLLSTLTLHSQEASGHPAWQRLRSSGALQAIGNSLIIDFVCRVFRAGHADQVKIAAEIVRGQGRSAVPPLIGLLAEPLSAAAENAVMEVLVKLSNEAVPELARSLQSGYSQAGICVVKALSEIGTEEALRALGKGLQSKDVLVRLAVVQALGKRSGDFSVSLLVLALEDGNASVRRAAANALGELRSSLAVAALAKLATAFSWWGADLAERMEVITALGKVADDAAIAALGKVLRGRRLLGGSRQRQLRECARLVLQQIGTPSALQVLESKGSCEALIQPQVRTESNDG